MNSDSFSKTLLELYRLSRTAPIAQFQRLALDAITAHFEFDTAWWGMAAMSGRDLTLASKNLNIHASFPYRLPSTYSALWNDIKQDDLIAEAVLAAPGTTVNFSRKLLYSTPGLASLMARFGIVSCLCTVRVLPELNLMAFASLYRLEGKPAFSESDRRYKQLLMPHMTAALTANWMIHLERARASRAAATGAALAVVDRKGLLYVADAELSDQLRHEWPNWVGPLLPAEMTQCIQKGTEYRGTQLRVRFHPVGDVFLVDLKPMSDIVRLSPREIEIAQHFSEGLSYKEVAKVLNIAPSTARHYLREIYLKLNVSDKAELSRRMQASPADLLNIQAPTTLEELPGLQTKFDTLSLQH